MSEGETGVGRTEEGCGERQRPEPTRRSTLASDQVKSMNGHYAPPPYPSRGYTPHRESPHPHPRAHSYPQAQAQAQAVAPPPPPPPPPPLSISKAFRPFYSPFELVHLVRIQALQRGDDPRNFSDAKVEFWRQLACGYIERVGGRLGLSVLPLDLPWRKRLLIAVLSPVCSPRRTIATAQTLYHRFHLHFRQKEFGYQVSRVHSTCRWNADPVPPQDVSLAALLVSSKLEDTLKKLREIQIAAWQINNILEGGPGTADGDTTVRTFPPSLVSLDLRAQPRWLFSGARGSPTDTHRHRKIHTPDHLLQL